MQRKFKNTISNCAEVSYAYKDKDGREWGKTKYTGAWICLSDPDNSNIPPFNPAPKPAEWSRNGIYDWSKNVTIWPPVVPTELPVLTTTESTYNIPYLMIILLIILVVVMVVLIRIFRKSNKTGKEKQ